MFNMNIAGSDDDIFDDSKSLSDEDREDRKESIGFSPGKISKKEFNMAMESILDVLNKIIRDKNTNPQEAQKLIQHLKKEHGIELRNFMAMFRIKLAITILDGSGGFIEDFQTHRIPRSVVYVLDDLYENKFTLIDKFFNIELENAKRIVIARFLQEVFLNPRGVTGAIDDLFDSNMDSRYVKTYYQSLYDINLFTIWQNNGVYVALGKELNLPCNQKILNVQEVLISDLLSERYSDNKFSSVIGSLLKKSIGDSVAEYTARYLEYVKK